MSSQHHSAPPSHSSRPGCAHAWCLFLTIATGLYFVALVILEQAVPERWLPAYLAVYLPQPLLILPMAAAPFFSLIFWRPRLLLASLLIAALAIGVLMPPHLPRRPRTPATPPVRILTWNVHERFRQLPQLRQVLQEYQPHIVCLQEARRQTFATLLPKAQSAHTREVTTLTTGRIERQRPLRLGPYPNIRWALETTIALPQGRLTVLNVHLMTAFTPRTVKRNRQALPEFLEETRRARLIEADAVSNWLRQTPGPRMVAGDFNSPPNSDVYQAIARLATDAFISGTGWGYTYRRDRPLVRIDHVFCAGGVKPIRAFAVDGRVSDHRLVVVDVTVGEAD